MTDRQKCDCCGDTLHVRWTDRHGVAVCMTCGLPYTIYHYEGDKRVDKPPEPALTAEGVEVAKRYWSEKQRRVFPAYFDMGGNPSYSGATHEEQQLFHDWYQQHYPREEAQA
jgi:hypothetical protein